jgi:hypothetical protein
MLYILSVIVKNYWSVIRIFSFTDILNSLYMLFKSNKNYPSHLTDIFDWLKNIKVHFILQIWQAPYKKDWLSENEVEELITRWIASMYFNWRKAMWDGSQTAFSWQS